MNMKISIKVLIVRDRKSAGGGIHGYFQAIQPHLNVAFRYCDVGRPHGYYGGREANCWFGSGSRIIGDWFRLGWGILRFRPQLVHLNAGLDREERSLKREAVSLRIASLLGCRVLVFWHGWDHPAKGGDEFPSGRGGWLWRSYSRAATHVVLAMRFKDDLERWGIRVPIHLATSVVSPELLERNVCLSKASGKNLLFLSRVERAKGLWELLEAYSLLKTLDPEYRLVIAGDGPDLAALKRRAGELGLGDVLFPGFLSGGEKIKCYQDASVFCFPSYSEGMPLAVLEALAMGLPVVSSDVGGLKDILIHGENGVLLTLLPEDPQRLRFDPLEIANGIRRICENPHLSRTIGEHNAQYARSRFAPERVARNLERIYHSTSFGTSPSH
jgi:glycosyltransferase involved in cell wall biosynthesis